MANLAPQARQRFFDANGDPLAGGKLYTYAAGTTTLLASYADSGSVTANTNPVILDSQGYATVYLSSSSYKFVLKNSLDVTQWTQDNIALPTVDSGFSTGDVKMSIKTVADSGWVLMNDTTIGNAASSATGRANADTETLYTLLWNNTANADCAVSTGRGASAAADFAANKTIALPKALGRALATYGAGSGLTARTMAAIFGEETHVLTTAELAAHTHVQNAHTHVQDAHGHSYNNPSISGILVSAASATGGGAGTTSTTVATNQSTIAVNQNAGSDTPHNNMQPTLFLNIMIKL